MVKASSHTIECVSEHACLLGEGPVWDVTTKSILWLDILNGQIHQYSTVTNHHNSLDVGQMIGCLAVTTNGNVIAGLKNGIGLVNRENGSVEIVANPEYDIPGNRFNDGKCDPAGRFWAGTMSLSEENGAGNLYMINQGFSVVKKKKSVSISNGMAWSPDHKTFYYIDTPTQKVSAFDFEIKTGAISSERSIITIPSSEGSPDGMTIDNDGMLWIAHWGGWQVSRWNPNTGEKLMHFDLPVARVTSCTFGGEKFDDLYITTAKVDLSANELKKQPLAGSLFVVKNCGYHGLPAVAFKL